MFIAIARGGFVMDRRWPVRLTTAAVLGLLIAACSTSGASPSASGAGASLAPVELSGTSWLLVDLDGAKPANSSARLTLEFRADGAVGGSAGCNTYGGRYTVDGTGIAFGQLLSTKMACEQLLMTIETTYLTALPGATAYGVDGDGNLVLTGSATLTFAPA
jgi:heat shock protein HslJ